MMKKILVFSVPCVLLAGLMTMSFTATSQQTETPETATIPPPITTPPPPPPEPAPLTPAAGATTCDTPDGQLAPCHLLIDCGPGPKGVAFSPDSKTVWVSILNESPAVEVYSVENGEKLKSIKLGDEGAVEVLFSRDGSTALVSQMQTDTIFEIDAKTYEIKNSHSSGNRWTKVVEESRDGRWLYSSGWISSTVAVVDRTGEVPTKRVRTAKTPRGVYLSPDEEWLYIASFGTGQLQRMHTKTYKIENLYQGGVMRHIVGNDETGTLFISDMRRGQIIKHDIATRKSTALARTDANPNTIDLTPDSKVVAVSCRGRNNPKTYYNKGPEFGSILLFDTETGRQLDGIVGGNQPTGLDVSPDGKWLATTDLLDARVRIYSLPSTDVLLAGDGGRSALYKAEMKKKGAW